MIKGKLMLLVLAVLVIASCSAFADDDEAPSTGGWTLVPVVDGNNVAIALSIDNAQELQGYKGLVEKTWRNIELGNGAIIDELVLGLDGDPRVALNFAVTAGASDTVFTISSAGLPFPLIPAEGLATAGISVTDNNGGGATATGLLDGGKSYQATYNNGTNFAYLVDPVTAAAWGTNTGSESIPPWQAMGSVSQMASQFQFSLTAGDGASGTSNYIVQTVVPEPSSVAALAFGLFGIAGTAIRRRK